MQNRDRLVATSRIVVRLGTIVNRLFLLAVSLGLLASFVFGSLASQFLTESTPGVDAAHELIGLRYEALIGLVMAVATDRLLVALGQMIETARLGDPFIAANARRLQTVGWSLLALQLLDIPSAVFSRYFPNLGSGPDGDYSVGGWVAVLLVFVLSRVFASGAMMRDELEGTI
jgi:hypothetical protein